jgi:hypothetical protein
MKDRYAHVYIRKLFVCFCAHCIFILFSNKAFSCTVFYLKNDTIILAGNNEDWKDPNSKMWFYPSVDNKFGWIKFGWGSGFPQGGMNDQGVFWDATSGPYLEMPYSEANKEKYQGALMKKVIEESTSIEDAISIFSKLYCEDQYKAQYLVGDTQFNSIIVEGDSIILIKDNYLILTNFYHSNPQLGGYPCWRYDTAKELFTNSEDLTTYLVGSILSATHQEGKYPTQYSQIYDLKNCRIYLFYYHNYEEFIVIDLKEELKKGYRSFDIPVLFAKIKLLTPISGKDISSSKVEFTWEGKPNFNYELIYSTDADFYNSTSEYIISDSLQVNKNTAAILFLGGVLLVIPNLRGRRRIQQLSIFLLLSVLNLQCEKDNNPDEEDGAILFKKEVDNLLPNSTYYWKIKSNPSNHSDFQSETLTKYFITGNPDTNFSGS